MITKQKKFYSSLRCVLDVLILCCCHWMDLTFYVIVKTIILLGSTRDHEIENL